MQDFAVDFPELESCRLAIVALADEFGQLAQRLVVETADGPGPGATLGQAAVEVLSTGTTQLVAAQQFLESVARGLALTASHARGAELLNAGLFAVVPGGP